MVSDTRADALVNGLEPKHAHFLLDVFTRHPHFIDEFPDFVEKARTSLEAAYQVEAVLEAKADDAHAQQREQERKQKANGPGASPPDWEDVGKTEKPGACWERAQSAPSFLAEEEKEFQGLAKDILAPGAITAIAAPRGLGKTQFSHALAVALGSVHGQFRGEIVQPCRVLLLDRDNPKSIIKKRLRAWGAQQAENLKVLTREDAPDLRDTRAWRTFPVHEYDVLIIDSVGSATEGVTEKEGKETTLVLKTIIDLARKGLAVLLLQNTTKDGLNIKGRGEWSDRADIVYEVRDATGWTPSGKRPWWMELPEAGEAAWADRAARRKGRIDFRLAFVPSKFRVGVQPDPFCIELHLPADDPWTLRDATEDLVKEGEDIVEKSRREQAKKMEFAAVMLANKVTTHARQKAYLLKTEAELFLTKDQELKREEARTLIKEYAGKKWIIAPRPGGQGRGTPLALLPIDEDEKSDGNSDSSAAEKTHSSEQDNTRDGEAVFSANPMKTDGKENGHLQPAFSADSEEQFSLPPMGKPWQRRATVKPLSDTVSIDPVYSAAEQSEKNRTNDELTPRGWFSELSDEDKERWIIEKNQEGAEQ